MRFLIVFLAVFLPLPALAQLEVCNNTNVTHRVAIGYEGETGWTSEGWWKFDPGECGIVMSGALTRQNYYYKVRAEGHDYGGAYAFCTGDSPFTIFGDTQCAERGFVRELFVLEDTGPTATRWTIALNGAPVASQRQTTPAPAPAPAPAGINYAALNTPTLEYIDYRAGFTPGTHGEPVNAVVRFIGCYEDGGGEWCTFAGDGVEWYVYPSDVNYSETFISISFLTPGQRVNLSADIVNFNDASVEIAVNGIEGITTPSRADLLYFALQGGFTDTRDTDSRVEVVGNTMFELYRNDQVAAYRIQLVENCDGTPATGPGLTLSDPETGYSNCAVLHYVGPDGFDYTEMGVMQGPSYRR